jgi:hypothetical protein
MQVVSPAARVRLAEPVHLVGSIRRIQIAQAPEITKAGARSREVLHADQDVDDRLSVEPRNCGAADVVEATGDPIADRLEERLALLLELRRPGWVVGLDADRLVGPLGRVGAP